MVANHKIFSYLFEIINILLIYHRNAILLDTYIFTGLSNVSYCSFVYNMSRMLWNKNCMLLVKLTIKLLAKLTADSSYFKTKTDKRQTLAVLNRDLM